MIYNPGMKIMRKIFAFFSSFGMQFLVCLFWGMQLLLASKKIKKKNKKGFFDLQQTHLAFKKLSRIKKMSTHTAREIWLFLFIKLLNNKPIPRFSEAPRPRPSCSAALKSTERSELQQAGSPHFNCYHLQSPCPCFDKLHHAKKPAENSQVKMLMI